jgi:hypothetical protein
MEEVRNYEGGIILGTFNACPESCEYYKTFQVYFPRKVKNKIWRPQEIFA